ncbi:hypothetical protein ABZ934_23655 [Streptomyces sp. NPDC046557]|uniref:hypothetical protein n=1 Tax=Streptomyces sp. NPDC046557 TaxID=3155372 RepID=UPI00340AFE92
MNEQMPEAESGARSTEVTPDQVRALLSAPDDWTLVLIEGHAEVVPSTGPAARRSAGALEVASGRDVAHLAGAGPATEDDVVALASRLSTMVAQLGA